MPVRRIHVLTVESVKMILMAISCVYVGLHFQVLIVNVSKTKFYQGRFYMFENRWLIFLHFVPKIFLLCQSQ